MPPEDDELQRLIGQEEKKLAARRAYESPIPLSQLFAKSFEANNYIVDSGLLNRGSILVLGGQPKTYKSFILNTMCYHLAIGSPLFNTSRVVRESQREPVFTVCSPQKCLYLEQEVGEYDLRERFQAILSGLSPAERTLCLEKILIHSCDHEMQLDNSRGRSHIARLIDDTKPDIVMFDPLIEFHSGDENSAKDMHEVMGGIDWLRERFPVTTGIAHHLSKPQKDSERAGPDNLRGSSVVFGKGDSFLMLRPEKRKQGSIQVNFTIRRGKPIPPLFLKMNPVTLRFEFDRWANDPS